MSHEQDDQERTATTTSSASDWLDDSIAFLAADLGHGSEGFGWLSTSTTAQEQEQQHDAGNFATETLPDRSVLPHTGPDPVAGYSTSSAVAPSRQDRERPNKRKSPEQMAPIGESSKRPQVGAEPDKAGASSNRKPSKKGGVKGGAAGGLDRDERWAEQLLNPCAAAIEAGNLPRAQHLLYVLGELASFSGESNHRLAAHGLRALALHLQAAVDQAAAASVKLPSLECPSTAAFAHVEPRVFRAALIKFHEASPWFALPNALANAAIAQVATRGAAAEPRRRIHVVDIGVSHGVQLPTLLDALTRVPRGSRPPSVHLTVAGPAATPPVPFSASPPGYDSSPQLLRYAKSIELDLAIDQAPCLDALHGITKPGEVLVVCVQFRLSHATADEQAAVLRSIMNLNPELVVLTELDGDGRRNGSVSSEFAARLELLRTFMESTAAAFKGRDAEEGRVMEAEAGTALTTVRRGAVVEGWEAWRARMADAGFVEAAFGDEAVETAKSLLRKYDGGWELVPPSPATGTAVRLRWKGQHVSFCSLWRPA